MRRAALDRVGGTATARVVVVSSGGSSVAAGSTWAEVRTRFLVARDGRRALYLFGRRAAPSERDGGSHTMHKSVVGVGVAVLATLAMAGTAYADHCTNAQRDAHDPSKGVQVVIDTTDGSIESANAGVVNRVNQGLIDPATGEGFHGNVGLDLDGDGTVDVMTYMVGPEGDALPDTAIANGSPDHGIVPIETVLGP
jgi:hypothetical protein